jgi:hypothetical protein
MWNPFKKPTNYPKQILHPKQLELINHIDETLVDLHQGMPVSGEMSINLLGIPFRNTLLPLNMILDYVSLQTGNGYVPRSIAFLVDTSGNWILLYAVRDTIGSDDILTTLFLDALQRTNNSRSQYEARPIS